MGSNISMSKSIHMTSVWNLVMLLIKNIQQSLSVWSENYIFQNDSISNQVKARVTSQFQGVLVQSHNKNKVISV